MIYSPQQVCFCFAKQTNMSEDEQNRKVLVYPSCLAEDIAAVTSRRGPLPASAAVLGTFAAKSTLYIIIQSVRQLQSRVLQSDR